MSFGFPLDFLVLDFFLLDFRLLFRLDFLLLDFFRLFFLCVFPISALLFPPRVVVKYDIMFSGIPKSSSSRSPICFRERTFNFAFPLSIVALCVYHLHLLQYKRLFILLVMRPRLSTRLNFIKSLCSTELRTLFPSPSFL